MNSINEFLATSRFRSRSFVSIVFGHGAVHSIRPKLGDHRR